MNEGESTAQTRRLVRRTDDKMIAGVCSGLADHFGADPLLFRIGFVVLAALDFLGVVAYLAAWALIPAAGAPNATPGRRGLPWVGVALLGFGAVVAIPALVDLMNFGFPLFPGEYGGFRLEPLALAGLLVAVGLVLLREREEGAAADAEPDSVPGPGTPVAAGSLRLPAALRVRPPRERSGLTPLTLAVALLLPGGAALLSSAGRLSLDVGQLAALSLFIVGLGLVVGAWAGRARLLIPVGILMVPIVLVTSLVDFPPSGTIGSPYVLVRGGEEIEDMRVLVGQPTLDLTEYPFEEGREEVRLRVAAGSMNVILPHDVRVEADVTVRGGEAYVFGGHRSGFDLDIEDVSGPEDATKSLDLHITAGFGTVGIYQMNPPDNPRDPRDRREGRDARDGRGRREKPRRKDR